MDLRKQEKRRNLPVKKNDDVTVNKSNKLNNYDLSGYADYEKIAIAKLGRDVECGNCGKQFLVPGGSKWAYRRLVNGKMKYFCSWSCFRKDERK